jgi:hypothetical protein
MRASPLSAVMCAVLAGGGGTGCIMIAVSL